MGLLRRLWLQHPARRQALMPYQRGSARRCRSTWTTRAARKGRALALAVSWRRAWSLTVPRVRTSTAASISSWTPRLLRRGRRQWRCLPRDLHPRPLLLAAPMVLALGLCGSLPQVGTTEHRSGVWATSTRLAVHHLGRMGTVTQQHLRCRRLQTPWAGRLSSTYRSGRVGARRRAPRHGPGLQVQRAATRTRPCLTSASCRTRTHRRRSCPHPRPTSLRLRPMPPTEQLRLQVPRAEPH